MVGSTGTLMTMRLVRSKLRKREESSAASPATVEAQHTNFGPHSRSNSSSSDCSSQQQNQSHVSSTSVSLVEGSNTVSIGHNDDDHQITFTRTSGGVLTSGWVFPPKAPTPNIYNCNNNFDTLIAANDKNGFKGFRKQFSGRFKRLVAKKTLEPASAIPPELKPQLKTIYVY